MIVVFRQSIHLLPAASIRCSYSSIYRLLLQQHPSTAPTAASPRCSYSSIHPLLPQQLPSAAPTAASIRCSYRSTPPLLLQQLLSAALTSILMLFEGADCCIGPSPFVPPCAYVGLLHWPLPLYQRRVNVSTKFRPNFIRKRVQSRVHFGPRKHNHLRESISSIQQTDDLCLFNT
jgi:hypothetical protein